MLASVPNSVSICTELQHKSEAMSEIYHKIYKAKIITFTLANLLPEFTPVLTIVPYGLLSGTSHSLCDYATNLTTGVRFLAQTGCYLVRFQVPAAASMKINFSWDVAQCSMVEVSRRFLTVPATSSIITAIMMIMAS